MPLKLEWSNDRACESLKGKVHDVKRINVNKKIHDIITYRNSIPYRI